MFGFSKKKKTNGRNVIIPTLEGRVTNKSPGSLLARLFRDILKTTGLLNSVPVLIEKYEKNSNKDFSQIQASALSEDMTWKNFVDLILNLSLLVSGYARALVNKASRNYIFEICFLRYVVFTTSL